MNAVLDSGSHRTVLPFEVSEKIGLADLEFNESLGTPVGRLKTAPAVVRLDVLDSHFPSVVHWSFDELSVEIAEPSSNLPLPLVGWDLLHQFEACFNRQDGYILLRKLTVPS